MDTVEFILVLAAGYTIGKMVAKREREVIVRKCKEVIQMERRAKETWQGIYRQTLRTKEWQEKEISELKDKLEKYEIENKQETEEMQE